MAELLENLVSVDITDEQLDILDKAIDILDVHLPYLISLTEDEIKKLALLHDGNRPFCNAVLVEMKQWKYPLNEALKAIELEKDLNFTIKVAQPSAKVNRVAKRLYYTFIRSGAEALNMSLKFMDFLKHESGYNTESGKEAKIVLARLQVHFKERTLKASKTRMAKMLDKAQPKPPSA
jgi:hypothetical protein